MKDKNKDGAGDVYIRDLITSLLSTAGAIAEARASVYPPQWEQIIEDADEALDRLDSLIKTSKADYKRRLNDEDE